MIEKNLFTLSTSEQETSNSIYGTTVKCLVAPFHTYSQLEKLIDYTPSTYLFPERDMPIGKLPMFISAVLNKHKNEEIRIVTANQNIILDMIDTSVRILTEDGDVVPCPIKTFMANIHDIRYSIFENEAFCSVNKTSKSKDSINIIINRINDKKTAISNEEADKLKKEISLIGEPIISNKLLEMLEDRI